MTSDNVVPLLSAGRCINADLFDDNVLTLRLPSRTITLLVHVDHQKVPLHLVLEEDRGVLHLYRP
jgi:hypothetical protein